MSGMTNCSYKEGSVLDEDVKNDYLNSMTGFGGFESCEERHGQDDGVHWLITFYNMISFERIQLLLSLSVHWKKKCKT